MTEFLGQGREGPVEVFYTVVPRRSIPDVLREIDRLDPDAFIAIEEPREIRRGWLHSTPRLRLPVGLQVGEWARRVAARQLPERRARAAESLTESQLPQSTVN